MKKILFFLFCFLFIINVYGKEKTIDIHVFYGETCPHCKLEKEFLEEQYGDDETIVIKKYEVYYSMYNQKIWNDVQTMLNKPARGVPYLVIGNQVLSGFSEQSKKQITDIVEYYKDNNYRNLIGEMLGEVEVDESIILADDILSGEEVTVPILGKIDTKNVSLTLLAIVVGFVDGFNPCALWILLFLITMLINMNDRKRMWILGVTFLTTSAIVYTVFMVAWLNVAIFATQLLLIRTLIALFAVGAGGYNLYKFLNKKDDGCEIVNTDKKSNIIEKIKSIVKSKSFVFSFFGIIALAISVNFIELLCSAGLPLMFTNVLAVNNLSLLQYSMYIFIYMLMFLSIDITIFVIAMITFKVKAISTKYTKYSHLIGGIIMLIIGLLLLFKPEILMLNF